MTQNQRPKPPIAKKIPHKIITHNDTRVDNYFWMRLSDEQKNAEKPDTQTQCVLNYLNAENAYTKQSLRKTEDFQKKLFDEIVGRIKQDDESVPYCDNGYFYITRFEKGKEHPILCGRRDQHHPTWWRRLHGTRLARM